jgi:nucleoid DNA-binding protein
MPFTGYRKEHRRGRDRRHAEIGGARSRCAIFEVYPMNKTNLIDQIAQTTDRTKKEAEQVIDAVFAAVSDALERGEKVDLRGFGSFHVSGKKERQGRNPKTGEPMTIAARNVAVFKPGRELADRVNSAGAKASPVSAAAGDSAQLSDGPAKVHGDKIDM